MFKRIAGDAAAEKRGLDVPFLFSRTGLDSLSMSPMSCCIEGSFPPEYLPTDTYISTQRFQRIDPDGAQ
jgi:hypothetical protein